MAPQLRLAPSDKAEMLNRHFTSCFTPRTSTDLSNLPAHEGEVLCDLSCSSLDVFHELTSLRHNIAAGPDGISSQNVKGLGS